MFLQSNNCPLFASFPAKGRSNLEAEPPDIFFGRTVTLACGPPPQNLDFRITSTVWTRDGIVINEDTDDRHTFSRDERSETLTITNFLVTDDGKKSLEETRFQNEGKIYTITHLVI